MFKKAAMSTAVLVLFLGLVTATEALAGGTAYSNVIPRTDRDGKIIDAHDGNYVFHEGKWWYFAMGYGLCSDTGTVNGCVKCGSSWNNTIGVWSNTALTNKNWTKEGEVLPYAMRPDEANCTYFRSHGVYSKFTKKWVSAC